MTMTKARECADCGKVHDCAYFVQMQVLTMKLEQAINELVEESIKANESLLECNFQMHELEDK